MSKRVLLAGVGNIFLGDDGFGVEVARRMEDCDFHPDVFIKDFGIGSVHLAFELLNRYEVLVIIDAVQMGEKPGTVSLIEIDQEYLLSNESDMVADSHTMNPTNVIKMLSDFGGHVEKIYLVGCEPECLDETIALSQVVAEGVPVAIEMAQDLVARVLSPI